MRIGSLCSGIGSLELGLERAGVGSLAWQAEVDPDACRVLAAHWPLVPNLGDIKTVDWSAVEPVDLVCGGIPCQPVSCAGLRKGVNDERWLWSELFRCVGQVRPRWVVAENPPGITPWLSAIVGELAARGYVGRVRRIRASDIGAPHRRERLFIIAHADGF